MARITLAIACSMIAMPAAAQGRLGGGGALDISLTRIIVALLLCTMIAVLVALSIKRGGGKIDVPNLRRWIGTLPIERRITVVESRRVSQHADVCLIRCDGQEYLILSSQQEQRILREGVAPPAERAA